MIKTGGAWDSSDRPVFFAACVENHLELCAECHDYLLVAVNHMVGSSGLTREVFAAIDAGKKVFIDSGIFSLTQRHAEKHGITMDKALGTAPEDIDGFDHLFARYCEIIEALGDRAWGYIELDQGGRENKIKTRKRLEAMGFNPVPVYHPLNDGWDYFDELASTYDRICVGNVVQANTETRKRIIATIYERCREYPDLWVHLLGLTPNPWMNAYPAGSCDSSALAAGIRWGNSKIETASALQNGPDLPRGFIYDMTSTRRNEGGWDNASRLSGMTAAFMHHNWRGLVNDYKEAGLYD